MGKINSGDLVMDEKLSVIKVRNILMVTMPPESDDDTISLLQEKVLKAMEQYEAKGLILDISMVDTLDSFFARTVAETAQMVGLMGGKMVISGMRPSVAITATQLGLILGNVITSLDVDSALSVLENSRIQEKNI
jgi:rsbT antagonist protein RsbS